MGRTWQFVTRRIIWIACSYHFFPLKNNEIKQMLKIEKLWPGSYTISWTFWSLFLKRSIRNPSEWPQISFWPALKKKHTLHPLQDPHLVEKFKIGSTLSRYIFRGFFPCFTVFLPLEALVSLGKSKKRLNESLEEADGIINFVCKTRFTPFSRHG